MHPNPRACASNSDGFATVPTKAMPIRSLISSRARSCWIGWSRCCPNTASGCFPPTETLSMFLSQALSADRSCQRAVNDAAVKRLIGGLPVCSTHTGGYCRARARLPLSMLSRLTRTPGRP